MRVLVQIQDLDIVQLDVEILIYRLQDTANADVILELDCDGLVGQGLEEAAGSILSAQF